ncbi:MAG TPA: tetraacyldisaccharide 4'-kinase [Casimicrobiaceae bacterium]|nr:tetraacyldisaccharide 4'-kinase [Casimicrobiaceae bacterium]
MTLSDHLVAAWYTPHLTVLAAVLSPLALVFRVVVALRRALYRSGALRSERLPVPVVIVGNIVVGGSGKTPLAIALAGVLGSRGWHPGIVSRGHGGAGVAPRAVRADATAAEVGDEALLLARSGRPVWVGHDRPSAARALITEHPECDVIISDDGLQHYALSRDVEIAVVDAARGLGNGLPLPAGPLREPAARLDQVDAVVWLGDPEPKGAAPAFAMSLVGNRFVRVNAPTVTASAEAFRSGSVHAIAGIGNPQRFFDHLSALGITAAEHAFPDHHRFTAEDLALPGATAILMTEKDAVKCTAFADDRCWVLPVRAAPDPALLALIEEKLRGSQTARDSRLPGHQGSTGL